MSQNNLYKGLKWNFYRFFKFSYWCLAEIEKNFPNFVKEPDNRNVEYITTPEKDYGSYTKINNSKKNLRQWLKLKI